MHTSCSATRSLNEGDVSEVCGRWLKREREWQKPDEHTHIHKRILAVQRECIQKASLLDEAAWGTFVCVPVCVFVHLRVCVCVWDFMWMEKGRNKSQREMDKQEGKSQASAGSGPGSACSASNKVLLGMPTFSLRTHTRTHISMHVNSKTRTQSRTLRGNNKINEIFTTSASSKRCSNFPASILHVQKLSGKDAGVFVCL